MISNVLAAMVRHRHVVLMVGLLVASVNAVAVRFAPSVGEVLFLPLSLLTLGVLVLIIVSAGSRPAYFVVLPQTPAFATPAPTWKVFSALAFLGPGSASVGALVRATEPTACLPPPGDPAKLAPPLAPCAQHMLLSMPSPWAGACSGRNEVPAVPGFEYLVTHRIYDGGAFCGGGIYG